MYYFEWSLTLFVRYLPLDVCMRIWDSYLLLGEAFFVRAAVSRLCPHSFANTTRPPLFLHGMN